MPVSVDIVLPCYNPGNKWPHELEAFYNAAKLSYNIKFILVNDGTVGTKVMEQVKSLEAANIPVKLVSYTPNKGKGYALRQGVAASGSELVVYTDVDFPFTTASMLDVISQLERGTCDVAAGFRSESYYKNKMSGFRLILSKAFRFFIKRVLSIPVTDTQCGLKGFNSKGKTAFLQTTINRYLFDFEFIYSACKNKSLRVQMVEVQLKEGVIFSKMKLRVLVQETLNLLTVLLTRKT